MRTFLDNGLLAAAVAGSPAAAQDVDDKGIRDLGSLPHQDKIGGSLKERTLSAPLKDLILKDDLAAQRARWSINGNCIAAFLSAAQKLRTPLNQDPPVQAQRRRS